MDHALIIGAVSLLADAADFETKPAKILHYKSVIVGAVTAREDGPVTLLTALILALLGALGTAWIVWLRRENERDCDVIAEQVASLTAEVTALRTAVDAMRVQMSHLRGTTEATRAELTEFVHGPPSVRRPSIGKG